MESQLAPQVTKLFEEDFLLEKGKDFEFRYMSYSTSIWRTLRIAVTTPKGKTLCSWYEVKNGEGIEHLFSYISPVHEEHLRSISSFEMLGILKKDVNRSTFLSRVYKKRYRNALEDIAKLRNENDNLQEENCELRYAPGGEAYLEAKEHFEQFVL
ncbi:hypothetical protein ISTM_322 [Insectomime virus]|nr:hypothetical protein ISTM_322 [Insectomime virus]